MLILSDGESEKITVLGKDLSVGNVLVYWLNEISDDFNGVKNKEKR